MAQSALDVRLIATLVAEPMEYSSALIAAFGLYQGTFTMVKSPCLPSASENSF